MLYLREDIYGEALFVCYFIVHFINVVTRIVDKVLFNVDRVFIHCLQSELFFSVCLSYLLSPSQLPLKLVG